MIINKKSFSPDWLVVVVGMCNQVPVLVTAQLAPEQWQHWLYWYLEVALKIAVQHVIYSHS